MRLKLSSVRLIAMVCMSAGLLGAILGCGGGGAKTFYNHRMTTIGQELTDLKTARDQGAISQEDYEEQRERILKGKE